MILINNLHTPIADLKEGKTYYFPMGIEWYKKRNGYGAWDQSEQYLQTLELSKIQGYLIRRLENEDVILTLATTQGRFFEVIRPYQRPTGEICAWMISPESLVNLSEIFFAPFYEEVFQEKASIDFTQYQYLANRPFLELTVDELFTLLLFVESTALNPLIQMVIYEVEPKIFEPLTQKTLVTYCPEEGLNAFISQTPDERGESVEENQLLSELSRSTPYHYQQGTTSWGLTVVSEDSIHVRLPTTERKHVQADVLLLFPQFLEKGWSSLTVKEVINAVDSLMTGQVKLPYVLREAFKTIPTSL